MMVDSSANGYFILSAESSSTSLSDSASDSDDDESDEDDEDDDEDKALMLFSVFFFLSGVRSDLSGVDSGPLVEVDDSGLVFGITSVVVFVILCVSR